MKKQITSMTALAFLALATINASATPTTDKLLVQAQKEVGETSPKALKRMISREEPIVVLDIREKEQRSEGNIYADETYEITRGNLEFEIENKVKSKNTVIITYCRSGGRGILATQTLRKMGYKNASNLEGGLKAWGKAGYPIDSGLGVVVLVKEDDE